MIPFSQKWLSHFWAMYGVKPKWMQMSYFSSIFLVVWWFVVFYILCLLWKMIQIYIMMMQIIYNNVTTCIFWCKLLGLFKHWYMSCDYTAFVIQPYDKCRIIAWQMSRNRSNCFLASYKSQHCYHSSHPWQFAGGGMWWGWDNLLHLRTWEGAGNGVQWMQGRRWIKGVFQETLVLNEWFCSELLIQNE